MFLEDDDKSTNTFVKFNKYVFTEESNKSEDSHLQDITINPRVPGCATQDNAVTIH